MSRVFVYVVRFDTGFSPNPFHGWCTLACCKPAIRRTAEEGSWIVGVTPRKLGRRLVFAMRVKEVLSFDEYWRDRRFKRKRPVATEGDPVLKRCGDNCYEPTADEGYRQLPGSAHWDSVAKRENPEAMARDTSGPVLVARRFCYFGEGSPQLPPELDDVPYPGRGHRVKFTHDQKLTLLRFLRALPQGVHGRPRRWKDGDSSWRQTGAACG